MVPKWIWGQGVPKPEKYADIICDWSLGVDGLVATHVPQDLPLQQAQLLDVGRDAVDVLRELAEAIQEALEGVLRVVILVALAGLLLTGQSLLELSSKSRILLLW